MRPRHLRGRVLSHLEKVTTMRAMSIARFGGPEVLELHQLEAALPGPQQVRVQVAFAGVNPMDLKIRSGAAFFPVVLPTVLGREFSGVVDAVGASVKGVEVGARVAGLADIGHGTYAEFTIASTVIGVPDEVALEQAAAVPIAAGTASRVLGQLGIGPGDVLLVNGASGAVGSMAVQLAIGLGATVVGVVSSARQPEVAALGATPTTYGPGLVQRVRALVPRIDAALDVAGRGALPDLIELLGGTLRLLTVADDQAAALGVTFSTGAGFGHDPAHVADVLRRLAAGALHVPVGVIYPLDQAAVAHDEFEQARGKGKVLLQP